MRATHFFASTLALLSLGGVAHAQNYPSQPAQPVFGNPCGPMAPPAYNAAVAAPPPSMRGAPGMVAPMAPPPPPPETPPPPPGPGVAWMGGQYMWNGGQFLWQPGRWVPAPQPGMQWRPGQWVQQGPQWVQTPGTWVPAGAGMGIAMPPGNRPPMYPQQPAYPPQQPGYPPPGYPQPGYPPGGMRPPAGGGSQIGGTFTGTLQPGDTTLPTGALADDFGVMLTAGQTLTIDVVGGPSTSDPGQNLDMYLSVLQNGAELAHDDDSGGNLNAHLVFTAPSTGQYVLRVTTYGSRPQTGSYTVRTAPGAQGAPGGVAQPGFPPGGQPGYPPGGQPGYPQPGYPPPGYPPGGGMRQPPMYPGGGGGGGRAMPVAVGQTVNGQLAQGDTQLQDGSVGDDYTVFLQAGQPVTIVTRGGPSMDQPGQRLDMYTLVLQNNRELAHDDDSAGNFNSRIVFTAPAPGPYTIRVTTYGAGLRQGAYQLSVLPGANPTAQ